MAGFLRDWDSFFHLLTALLRKWEVGKTSEMQLDNLYSQLDNCTSTLQYLLVVMDSDQNDEDILVLVALLKELADALRKEVLPEIEQKKETVVSLTGPIPKQNGLQARTGKRGRPSFVVDIEQVVQLRCLGFKWKDIANVVGVSVRTLHRKRQEANVGECVQFSMLSDEEVCSQLVTMKQEFPDMGERMALGLFRSKGIFLPRRRVREAFHLVDPINTSLRWHARIKRRVYSVPGPMSLWHIGELVCH